MKLEHKNILACQLRFWNIAIAILVLSVSQGIASQQTEQFVFATEHQSFPIKNSIESELAPTNHYDLSCEIISCRAGGKVASCSKQIEDEWRMKSKYCNQLIVGSGVSAYAMVLSLPNICIKSDAVIKIHRPYFEGLKVVEVGSFWHRYFFDRISPNALKYFIDKGGLKRKGFANAALMIPVPADKTGVPICGVN